MPEDGKLSPVLVTSKLGANGAAPLGFSNSKKAGSNYSLLGDKTGADISFKNICYSIDIKTRKCSCGRKEKKFILQGVSGVFRPGMNAILGPTGSGKTSLLDILAGRKDTVGLSGQVLVDGQKQPQNFKCMSGYVIQDDIVMGMLTVRENIQFSAALRLPKNMPQEKRRQRVDDVIAELGLSNCSETRIGTEFSRGVSGGERKRTSIGMELITSPSVLFLDEPTTGLDSHTAHSVIYLLQKLSRKGRTIIFSIHQPRYSIFKLFDSMQLLSRGESVYHGPASEALQYFESIGYICEEHNNPSDFFLDILNGGMERNPLSDTLESESKELQTTENVKETETKDLIVDVEEEVTDSMTIQQKMLVEMFQKSQWRQRVDDELKPIFDEFKQNSGTRQKRRRVSYPTNFFTQLMLVSGRTFRNMIRNPHTLTTQLFSAIILGLIVGTIYFQIDSTFTSGIQNRVGAFFFIVTNHVFGNMAAVDLFIRGRALFIHENVSGYYRIVAFFLSKLFCEVIPMRAFPIIIFSTITYWMIGLQKDLYKFLFYMLNTFLTSLAGTSVALVFSASVEVHTIGTILTALVWVFMMIFSGLLVNVDTIAVWLRWFKWLSIFRYSMNAFTVNELKDAEFCGEVDLPAGNTTVMCDKGNLYLKRQGIAHETTWDLWHNELALLLLASVCLLITYIQLRRMKKSK